MAYTHLINVTSDPGSGFDRIRADVGQTGFFEGREAANVGSAQDDERYLSAGSYFIIVQPLAGVNDTSEGIYSISWEERP